MIDSSDVILHVLDARDPMGTMCESVLEYVRKEKGHKQVVLVINKCDLVPGWVTVRPSVLSSPPRRMLISTSLANLYEHRPATSNT